MFGEFAGGGQQAVEIALVVAQAVFLRRHQAQGRHTLAVGLVDRRGETMGKVSTALSKVK